MRHEACGMRLSIRHAAELAAYIRHKGEQEACGCVWGPASVRLDRSPRQGQAHLVDLQALEHGLPVLHVPVAGGQRCLHALLHGNQLAVRLACSAVRITGGCGASYEDGGGGVLNVREKEGALCSLRDQLGVHVACLAVRGWAGAARWVMCLSRRRSGGMRVRCAPHNERAGGCDS